MTLFTNRKLSDHCDDGRKGATTWRHIFDPWASLFVLISATLCVIYESNLLRNLQLSNWQQTKGFLRLMMMTWLDHRWIAKWVWIEWWATQLFFQGWSFELPFDFQTEIKIINYSCCVFTQRAVFKSWVQLYMHQF